MGDDGSGENLSDAFNDLYRETFTQVLAYCRRRCRTPSDVDDAVSETYLVAWRRLDQALSADSSIAWLYGVAYRVLSNQRRGTGRGDRLRERIRRQPRSDLSTDPASTVVVGSEVDLAFKALNTLNARDRELIRLAAFENLSYAEIATVMNTPVASVRSSLFRARKRLHDAVGDNAERDSDAAGDTNKESGNDHTPGGGELQ